MRLKTITNTNKHHPTYWFSVVELVYIAGTHTFYNICIMFPISQNRTATYFYESKSSTNPNAKSVTELCKIKSIKCISQSGGDIHGEVDGFSSTT